MAEHGISQRSKSSSGNKRIATTFLESLAARGQAAAHQRALRALELAEGGLAAAAAWLPDDALGRMFAAADTGVSLARSVGHRLMTPEVSGLSLYGLGLATPEKAYRRVGALLPRDCIDSCWVVHGIGGGSARIEYRDRPVDIPLERKAGSNRSGVGKGRGEAALCALRVGMLEAVPGLFGLLPAHVEESTCLSKGSDACRYEIRWQRSPMVGLGVGSAVGTALAVGLMVAALSIGSSSFPLMASGFCAVASFGLSVAVGRSFDLNRQLEAVAGARRGHLALFDQVDDALAAKLDTLARVDAKLEGDEFAIRAARSPADSGDDSLANASVRTEIWTAAQKIHATAGELECWFEDAALSPPGGSEIRLRKEALDEGRGLIRQIRAWAAKITEDGAFPDRPLRDPVDLLALVTRAIAAARPVLPDSTVIQVEHDDDLIPILCEPVQIERVVVQLLVNAAEASCALSESPEVFVTLRSTAQGLELAVEDHGVGIEPALLDEVFDPFFTERGTDIDEGGLGLPACLQIVERHGGELRIEAGNRPGTRVSILLPQSAESDC